MKAKSISREQLFGDPEELFNVIMNAINNHLKNNPDFGKDADGTAYLLLAVTKVVSYILVQHDPDKEHMQELEEFVLNHGRLVFEQLNKMRSTKVALIRGKLQ